jgi:hypothetical protein
MWLEPSWMEFQGSSAMENYSEKPIGCNLNKYPQQNLTLLYPNLGFQASILWELKFLFFTKHIAYGILLWKPKLTKTHWELKGEKPKHTLIIHPRNHTLGFHVSERNENMFMEKPTHDVSRN